MRTSSRSQVTHRRRANSGRRRRKTGCGCLFYLFSLIILVLLVLLLIKGGGMTFRKINKNIAYQQYPIKYENLVNKYSKKYDVDKYLVYAVIRTESKFDQYAVSSADAYGLMQLQTETASDCAKKLKINVSLPDDLYVPDINIHLGTYYLSWLLDRYDGNVSLAIAAYNGGIGNVDKWLDDHRYADGDGGLKDIPFGETSKYVTSVTTSYQKYKEIYE